MKKIFFVICCTYFTGNTFYKDSVFAQAPAIQWQISLGGDGFDGANSIQQTSDEGYIVAGASNSNDDDVSGNHGNGDYWIVKLSSLGSIQWQKSFGGSEGDGAESIQQTFDGGYIVAGNTGSNDGDISGFHGIDDFWIVKLNDTGGIQWQKALGGSLSDETWSVRQTVDSGYIIAGYTTSIDGDVSGNHGGGDAWIVKLSATGAIQWQKAFGGTGDDAGRAIQQTLDGGYIFAGMTNSVDGDIAGNHGGYDSWVVKLSATGSIQWQKVLGGTGDEIAFSIQQTSDSGYIVAGNSNSNDGDVSGNHGLNDVWVVKLSPSGGILWQKSLGGSLDEYAFSIQQTSDNGYIIAGYSASNDGDISGHHDSLDYWVIKLSISGSIQWQRSLGGSGREYANSIQQTFDGGYIIAGSSYSNNGDVSGNHGSSDYWVVKLSSTTSVNSINNNSSISIIPNPTTGNISIKGIGIANIKTYNAIGQLIKECSNTDNISISEFPSGMYFIKLFSETGEMIYADKIIRQ